MNSNAFQTSFYKNCKKIIFKNGASVFGLIKNNQDINKIEKLFQDISIDKSNQILSKKGTENVFSEYKYIKYSEMILSRHVLPGMNSSLNTLAKMYPDNYLVCVQYYDRDLLPKKKILKDVQIGITETLTKVEYSTLIKDSSTDRIKPVINRAIEEEFCKNITEGKYEKLGNYQDRNRNLYAVSLQLDENSNVQNIPDVEPIDNKNDCENKSKIMLFIHGPFDTMTRIFNQFSTTEEEIGSYVLIKLSDAPVLFFNK